MPIVVFRCKQCGEFERIILSAATAERAAKAKCPACGMYAQRFDSMETGTPILKAGCGGFHRPNG